MWFLDWMVDSFNSLSIVFADTATDVRWVPALGEYLAYPFDLISGYFGTLKTSASNLNSWVNTADFNIATLFGDLTTLWDYCFTTVTDSLNSVIASLNNTITYTYGWLTDTAENALLMASQTAADISGWVSDAIDAAALTASQAYDYAYGALTDMVNDASRTAGDAYNRAFDVGSGLASDVWTWITSFSLPAYLDLWKAGLQEPVIQWVSDSMEYLITVGFDTLDRCWSTFEDSFIWLTDRIIDLVKTEAGHFAEPLWYLLEAVVDKLWER